MTYHFHWPLADVLDLEHGERHRYVEEIGKINMQIQGASR